MKKIMLQNSDDTVAIIIPAPKEHLENLFGQLTDEEYESHVYERNAEALHNAVSYRPIEDSEIPSDRYFREAWHYDGETVAINMERAREVQMNNIRFVRNKKLAELDIETLKGNDVQAEKQVLRDIPANFNLTQANTPEELKALWPDELGKIQEV